MSNIASMVVNLELNFAKWEQNLNAATAMAENSMKRISGAADLAKNALGGLGGILTVGGLAAWVKSIVEATARLKDMEAQTGVSGERLSALARVAKLADTDMGEVAGGLQKLSKRMYDTYSGNAQAGQAFAAMTLDVKDGVGKLKDPDKMLWEIAKKLDTYRDGAGKTALMMEIFGKSGANLGKFLGYLAEQQDLVATRSQAQIDAADRVNEAIKRMTGAVSKAASGWVLDWLPALEKALPLLKTVGELAAWWFGLFVLGPKVLGLAAFAFRGFMTFVETSVLAFKVSGTAMEALTMQLWGVNVASTIAGGGMAALMAVAGLAFAAFAGWKLGEVLSENFLQAQLAGNALVRGLMVGWEWLKFGFNAVVSGMQTVWGGFIELIGAGLAKIPGFGKSGEILQRLGQQQKGTAIADLAAQRDAAIAQDGAIFDAMAEESIAKFAEVEAKAKAAKPDVPPLPATGTDGAENLKRGLDSTLRMLDQGIAAEKKRLDESQAMRERYYRDDLLSINDYFGGRVESLWQAADATQAYYDKEITALQQYQAKFKPDSTSFKDAAAKMTEIGGKSAESWREYTAKIEQAAYDQGKAFEDLRRKIQSLEADYQSLLGNGAAAAALRFDGQNEQLRKRLEIEGQTDALAKLAALRARAIEDAATDGFSGASRATRRYVEESANLAKQVENLFIGAFQGMEDALVNFVKTGKLDFKSLAESIISDLIRMQVRAAMAPVTQGITGWLQGLFSVEPASAGLSNVANTATIGANHEGGLAGLEATFTRNVPLSLFSSATRYHTGGILPGEVPIIARRGEGIFTPEQMRALAPVGQAQAVQGGNVTVNVVNNAAGTQATAKERTDSGGNRFVDVFIEQIKGAIASDITRGSGSIPSAMQRTYGLNQIAGSY